MRRIAMIPPDDEWGILRPARAVCDTSNPTPKRLLAQAVTAWMAIALLVSACSTPAASPSGVPSQVVTPRPTLAPRPALTASTLSRDTCELAIDMGDTFESLLLQMAQTTINEDKEAEEELVDRAVDLAEDLLSPDLFEEDADHPAVKTLIAALEAVDASRLDYLTGDSSPFIDAIGDTAIAGKTFRSLCA